MSLPLRLILDWLETLAPATLAEDWDNTGLLLGDHDAKITRVVTCLTLTPDVAAEAIAGGYELIISHHPLFFRPIQKLTTGDSQGRMVLKLARAGINVFSPHTAYDSAQLGINQQLAEKLELQEILPLRPAGSGSAVAGGGRMGHLQNPQPLKDLLPRIRQSCGASSLQWTGDPHQVISKVAVACGSAGEFLRDAHATGCDLLVTGETRFHTHLEARELGMGLVLLGHYASERPGVERLAELCGQEFPQLQVHASRAEHDPVQWSIAE